MYYEARPSEVFLQHKNVEIFTAYKNDDPDSPFTYWFGVSPWVTDCDIDDSETSAFDVRDMRTASFPFGKNALTPAYVYDPEKTIEQNLIHLIELGGIDNQN